jgi:DNA-binding NarL/FixJ family response regulator
MCDSATESVLVISHGQSRGLLSLAVRHRHDWRWMIAAPQAGDDLTNLVGRVATWRVRVVVLETTGGGDLDLIRRLGSAEPPVECVAVAMPGSTELRDAALAAGAACFLPGAGLPEVEAAVAERLGTPSAEFA